MMHSSAKYKMGKIAESKCEAYLVAMGWEILARNWRIRGGELDLVARDGSSLVFVEVRYRGENALVPGECSLSSHKLRYLIRTARAFLQRSARPWARTMRFDVVVVDATGGILHIPEAFTCNTVYR